MMCHKSYGTVCVCACTCEHVSECVCVCVCACVSVYVTSWLQPFNDIPSHKRVMSPHPIYGLNPLMVNHFLDINNLIQIVTMLRASSSFELFGLGSLSKEDLAALLGALASCFFSASTDGFPTVACCSLVGTSEETAPVPSSNHNSPHSCGFRRIS